MRSMIEKGSRGMRGGRAVPMAAVLTFTFGLMACGEAESREDLEGERIDPPAAGAPAGGGGGAATRAPTPPPVLRAIPAGTELVFEVTESVSTSSHNAGDGVSLRLMNGVSGTGGASIPAGTLGRGVVTQSHRSSGPDDDALLVVDIRSLHVNGASHNLSGTVVSATTETSSQSSAQRTAATIAIGAAAGAVVGQILGRDTRSTVAGAAVGAAAGTAVALSTRGGHANLPVGSQVTVRLSEAMTLQ